MSTEELVKAVGYLRSSGGYFLTVEPTTDGIICIGSFKDVGSYSSTVSYASFGTDMETIQADCIINLAKLVKVTASSKPNPAKPAAAAPTGGAIVSLKGLSDKYWGKAKDAVKAAGFRFDKDSKDWIGGNVSALPEYLQKRVKGASNGFKKPAPVEEDFPEERESEEDNELGDLSLDNIPF